MTTGQTSMKDMLSFQNLQEGAGTPLRHFKAVLQDYNARRDDGYNRTFCDFVFTDLEVISSIVPYNYDNAVVAVKYSNRANSAWGILAESVKAILGDDADIHDLVGKSQTWIVESKEWGKNREDGKDMTGLVFKVVEIEGTGVGEPASPPAASPAPAPTTKPAPKKGGAKQSAEDAALALLDGKTQPQFNAAALVDPAIKGNSDVLQKIISNLLIAEFIADEKVTVDENGIFHKV